MNKDFIAFQKYFKEYQVKFGLTGYKVYFKYEPLDGKFAQIDCEVGAMVAIVTMNNNLPNKDKPFSDIKYNAKHEALHLLAMRFESNGKYRYAQEAEIDEASEELVNKLAELISD